MAKRIQIVEVQVTRINREKFAVVPLEEYKAFLRAHRLRKAHHRPRPTKIASNPELAQYLQETLGTMPVDAVMEECRRRFGAENVPARSRVYHHWQKLRRDDVLKSKAFANG